MYIEIKVSKILKEFYTSVHGSDNISVTKGDLISSKIKYLLSLPPINYTPKQDFPETLRIQLLDFRIGKKCISKYSNNYLDTQAQRILFNELNKGFKEIFHNYVLAFVRGNHFRDGSQKNGILDFCQVYNLSMDHINYEMLKKSWDRSQQKKNMRNNYDTTSSKYA